MEVEGLSFPEAVEKLAAEAGMEVPHDTAQSRERQKKRQSLQDINELATRIFQKTLNLPESKSARKYLIQRGLHENIIKRFRIGFAPMNRHYLLTALSRENVELSLAIAAGLIIQPEHGKPYDRFRDRIMFPICDRRGRTIGFGGRSLGDGEPKYLNSPETELFQKGSTLYGMHLAAATARKVDTMLLAEGYMDVIALAQAGFEYSVLLWVRLSRKTR